MRVATTNDTADVEAPDVRPASVPPKEQPKPKEPEASIRELYQFTSPTEKALLAVGAVAATGSGVAMPLLLIAFGTTFDQLGAGTTLDGAVVDSSSMNQILLTFAYIAAGLFAGRWIYYASVEYVCASQLFKYKTAFLRAVLRQDVAWYDTSNPEELSTMFAESIVKVQKGLGGMAFMLFEGLGYGTGGFVMGFYYQPEVAAIVLATVPLLIVPAIGMMYFVENGEKIKTKAYGEAGGTAAEALFAVRTIASLGIEETVSTKYRSSLGKARSATVINATSIGLTAGMALSSYLVMMAAAIIYGAFKLAGEMDRSAFDYTLPCDGAQLNYCADHDNNPVSVLYNTSCVQALLQPLRMTCSLAFTFSETESTPVHSVYPGGVGALPCVNANGSLLELYGFGSDDQFRTFVTTHAPVEYVAGNTAYYNCSIQAKYILLAVFAVMMAGEGYSMAGQPAQVISIARQAAARILAVISRVPAIDSFDESGAKPASVRGEIELRDVVFAYPTAVDTPVCKNYSLSIGAGQTVALCGPSGSGKSTIIQLLERFYDPQGGVILLDGADIKTLNVRWLRAQMGLVGQEPVLFQGSVAMNIGYGKPTEKGAATQEEIEAAAKMANAHGFVSKDLPDGYASQVGLKGGRLSGGQKQRIAIARALIKKPSVLLLDEATSALDNESERIVQAALDEIMTKQKRTTVVIAHRLSTIRNADKIAVVNDGKIIEEGSHDELLANRSLYANLVMAS